MVHNLGASRHHHHSMGSIGVLADASHDMLAVTPTCMDNCTHDMTHAGSLVMIRHRGVAPQCFDSAALCRSPQCVLSSANICDGGSLLSGASALVRTKCFMYAAWRLGCLV